MSDLVCVVSTIKDTWPNVELFVRRNLDAGADHLFVFLETDDEDVRRGLADHPHVTAVDAGAAYWGGPRPESLNARQHVNANLVNFALVAVPRVRWLFHLDGDECLDVDRDRLLALDADHVTLTTREAVSQWEWRDEDGLFKDPLTDGQLADLAERGLIRRATNKAWFRGHVAGKPGLRPTLQARLRNHWSMDATGEPVPAHRETGLRVLHYDAHSFEEFARKWATHVESEGTAAYRGSKAALRERVARALAEAPTREARRAALAAVYRERVEEDVTALQACGVLTRLDPARHRHRPGALTSGERGLVEHLVAAFSGADKRHFATGPRRRDATRLYERTVDDARA